MQSDQLATEGTLLDVIAEPHFSCRLREKYHLLPFRVRTTLQINRHVGEPVRYVFMSREEVCIQVPELKRVTVFLGASLCGLSKPSSQRSLALQ